MEVFFDGDLYEEQDTNNPTLGTVCHWLSYQINTPFNCNILQKTVFFKCLVGLFHLPNEIKLINSLCEHLASFLVFGFS